MKKQIMIVLMLVFLATNAFGFERKPFGIGIVAGSPSGISLKYMLNSKNGIAGTIGWSTSEFREVHISADYLFHEYDIVKIPNGISPLYFGIGARYFTRENKDNQFGIRVPVGLEYVFLKGSLGAFGELVPTLNLTPDTDFELEFGLGIRYFF